MVKKQFLIVVIISGLLLLLEFISFLIIPSFSLRTEIVLVQGIIRSLLIPITASLFGVFTFLFIRYRAVNKSLRAFLLVLTIISALGGYIYIMTKGVGNVIAYASVYYNDLSGNDNESIDQSETEKNEMSPDYEKSLEIKENPEVEELPDWSMVGNEAYQTATGEP